MSICDATISKAASLSIRCWSPVLDFSKEKLKMSLPILSAVSTEVIFRITVGNNVVNVALSWSSMLASFDSKI